MAWDLSNSFIYHPDETKAQYDRISCTAEVEQNGHVHIDFEIERRHTEHLRLDLNLTDLQNILLYLAETVPGASTLFAECITKAVAADEGRFAELAQCEELPHWAKRHIRRTVIPSPPL